MFAVVYIPDFALQAVLRTEPELYARPVVLLGETNAKATILQLTPAAGDAGVEWGMTPTQAMARCAQVLIKHRSLPREKTAQEALLQCAFCFSPAIESTAPGVCTLDLKGLRNAGAAEFGEKIIRALGQFHLRAQVGVAENPLLAYHAARYAQPFLAVKEPREFLDPLPLATIDPPPAIADILKKWGVATLGQFIRLGRDQVSQRLGPDALELFDRACANSTRPLKLVAPPETFEETIDFENEIETLEPLLFILRRFLEQISRRLELSYWVAESIQLQLRFSAGNPYERTFKIPAPTREVDTLFRMLHTHLENLRADHPIVGLQLNAKPCHYENHQFGLFETAFRDPNHFYETLARLSALVGGDRVGVPVLECTHRPDTFRLETLELTGKTEAAQAVRASVRPKSSIKHPQQGAAAVGESVGLRLRRFRPPLAAEVQVEQERPIYLKCSNYKGRVARVDGPWRNSGDWWETHHWAHEEWDVQITSGILFRICQQAGQWFVEGIYD